MRPSRMLLVAAPAHAIIRLPAVPTQAAHNPAERLRSQPIEDSVSDPATHCTRKQQPGMVALQHRRAGWAWRR